MMGHGGGGWTRLSEESDKRKLIEPFEYDEANHSFESTSQNFYSRAAEKIRQNASAKLVCLSVLTASPLTRSDIQPRQIL